VGVVGGRGSSSRGSYRTRSGSYGGGRSYSGGGFDWEIFLYVIGGVFGMCILVCCCSMMCNEDDE